MTDDVVDGLVFGFASFFGFVFLALQVYFHCQGDSRMMTLMCGLCLLCGGICAGWKLANKKGDDK